MKPFFDPSLYLVTRRDKLTLEDFFRIILHSIEGGVKVVQLREKESTDSEICEIGRRLLILLRPLGIPLIINDRVDIAKTIHADGVHLGQSDSKVREARAILGPQAIIGFSVESLEQAKAAENEEIDYLAASPIFHTRTKPDCTTPWGLNGLKQVCGLSRHPIIGIGGIDETNIEDVLECGVAGIAMVSAIFDALCPKTAAASMTQKLKKHRNSHEGKHSTL